MLNKALLSLFLFVAFAFTARAYQITSPSNNSQAWTVAGPNILAWERVNTDPSTFAIVLVNEVSPFALPPIIKKKNLTPCIVVISVLIII